MSCEPKRRVGVLFRQSSVVIRISSFGLFVCMGAFAKEIELVERICSPALIGRVSDVAGLTVTATGLPAATGTLCRIHTKHGAPLEAQVVGFRDDRTLLMPLSDALGVSRGDEVVAEPGEARVGVCEALLGRMLDGMGRPLDGGRTLHYDDWYPLYRTAPRALERERITRPIGTGIRAIDALTTVGRGQRMGLFAGTGVGKSVLMGMIARNTDADVVVCALIGERGREVNDFLEKNLGPEGRRKSVMVISTSDESPVLRVRAGFVATAVAEYFRDRGRHVLLLMDSVTRLAMAQRQIGLAAGEPPATKGYTPSVFGMLPQLLERAGQTERGSVTGIYTVLVEADDMNDPIGDAVRGILDGHLWLSRSLASKAHYPAISVTDSISRVMPDVVDEQHLSAARTIVRNLAVWNEIEDLVNIGAYAAGSNPQFDTVIQTRPAVLAFLQQAVGDRVSLAESRKQLLVLAQQIEETAARLSKTDKTVKKKP
ncbi:MAG TPA: FliI/YscN family ATPase [Phycisphaerae bacterium]|nr:FliI/YscN family ATPase [Phycisphaerae bacterium]HOJ74293.1 FliI/YscN family ATPase [Phycisphaerae bacterium]HOM51372.1 FliI/YscN family ATPase [Phycisphaerae bacterium]HON66910.1 FliI/YscN family ATPase [Phycisphaerae bacterium]HPU25991.1 FliI/YscN family ATPase [Phycisphaerae bacterium]